MNSATNLARGRSTATQPASRTFSLRETKELVQDLFAPKPILYWTDFLITVSVAYGFAAIYIIAPPFSLIQVTAFLLSSCPFPGGDLHPRDCSHVGTYDDRLSRCVECCLRGAFAHAFTALQQSS